MPAEPTPVLPPDARAERHYGHDCPVGMVQVEFVGCPPSARYSDYGWKPVESAFLELWVDGQRFRVDVGTFHDGIAERRGLHIIGPIDMGVERTAMNAASLFLPAASPITETPATLSPGWCQCQCGAEFPTAAMLRQHIAAHYGEEGHTESRHAAD